MKRIGIKIVAIFLIIIFFMNCGVISIIPSLGATEQEIENFISEREKEIESQGYQIAKIIQNQEITDWKVGDSLREKVGNKWDIQFTREEGIWPFTKEVTKTYAFNECITYEDMENLNEEDLKNIDDIVILGIANYYEKDKVDDTVKAGINIFVITAVYDIMSFNENNPQNNTVIGLVVVEAESNATSIEIIGENSLQIGETLQLEAEITPTDATNQDIEWSTSDSSIVSVDSNGKIKGKKVGKATITATIGDVSAEHEIEVKPIEVTSITIEGENTVQIGNEIELKATVKPAKATDKTITWASSDENIATVDEGIVTGIKEGQVIIIAKSGNVTQEHEIEVIGNDDEKDEIIITGEKSVQVEKNITLTATIGGEAINDGIIWNSSNEEIATVDENGIVYGAKVSDEEVIITAETEDGAKGEFNITVKETIPVEKIKIMGDKNQIKENEEIQLEVTFSPTNVTDKDVTWFSIDEEIATVDENGKVSAKKAGEAIIIAITKNMKIATFKLNIIGENEEEEILAESIKINGEKNKIDKDEELQLEAIITPENVTDKEVIWISGNEEIATVDENGNVIGQKEGNTIIIAITNNMKIATYEIAVVTEEVEEIFAESIKINGEKNKIEKDEELQLEAIITPENVTNKEVKWISENEEIATVNKEGKVTGKKEGSTTIIAMTNNMKMASYEITVVIEEAEEIFAESIKINGEKNKIEEDEEIQLEAVITPENVTNKEVVWSSSNEEIATVDKNGKVKGKKAGTATITAVTNNLKKAEYTIEIEEKSIELDKTSVDIMAELSDSEIKVGEKTKMKLSLNAEQLNADIGAIILKIEYPNDNIDITLIEENGMKVMSTEEIEEELEESFEEGTIAIVPNTVIKEGEKRDLLELEIEGLVETENANIRISDIVLECMDGEKIELNNIEKNIVIEEKVEEHDKPSNDDKEDYNDEKDNLNNDSNNKNNSDNNNSNNKDDSLYNGNLAYAGKNIITVTGLILMAISSFILYRKYKVF